MEKYVNLTDRTWNGFVGHMKRNGWVLKRTKCFRYSFVKGASNAPVLICRRQSGRHNNYKRRKCLEDTLYVVIMPL